MFSVILIYVPNVERITKGVVALHLMREFGVYDYQPHCSRRIGDYWTIQGLYG